MKKPLNLLVYIIFLFTLIAPSAYAEDLVYLDITSPESRKISIAVPDFKNLSTQKHIKKNQEFSKILSKALTFHGIIHIIPTSTYVSPDTNKANWQLSGADFVILGNLKIEKNNLHLELRLKDINSNLLLLARQYDGNLSQKMNILYSFCDDIIKELTNKKGVAQSRIAYISDRSGKKELYTSDILGLDIRKITRHNSLVVSPRFTPDGNHITYSSYHSGNPNLYITDLRQNKVTKTLSSRPGLNLAPAWSPNGSSFVLTLSKSGTPDLYLMSKSGKILKRLTGNNGINVSPTWSYDGKKIAFVSDRSGKPQIYIMDMSNYRVKRLTYKGYENSEPSWSPVNNMIVFSRLLNGKYQLFTKDLDSNDKPLQITYDHNNHESPSWSPDGKQIIFTKGNGKNKKIYAILKNGKHERMLFVKSGSQISPRWTTYKK